MKTLFNNSFLKKDSTRFVWLEKGPSAEPEVKASSIESKNTPIPNREDVLVYMPKKSEKAHLEPSASIREKAAFDELKPLNSLLFELQEMKRPQRIEKLKEYLGENAFYDFEKNPEGMPEESLKKIKTDLTKKVNELQQEDPDAFRKVFTKTENGVTSLDLHGINYLEKIINFDELIDISTQYVEANGVRCVRQTDPKTGLSCLTSTGEIIDFEAYRASRKRMDANASGMIRGSFFGKSANALLESIISDKALQKEAFEESGNKMKIFATTHFKVLDSSTIPEEIKTKYMPNMPTEDEMTYSISALQYTRTTTNGRNLIQALNRPKSRALSKANLAQVNSEYNHLYRQALDFAQEKQKHPNSTKDFEEYLVLLDHQKENKSNETLSQNSDLSNEQTNQLSNLFDIPTEDMHGHENEDGTFLVHLENDVAIQVDFENNQAIINSSKNLEGLRLPLEKEFAEPIAFCAIINSETPQAFNSHKKGGMGLDFATDEGQTFLKELVGSFGSEKLAPNVIRNFANNLWWNNDMSVPEFFASFQTKDGKEIIHNQVVVPGSVQTHSKEIMAAINNIGRGSSDISNYTTPDNIS